jgi:tRNA threonylcarbamoyladenosine biosynthesis protein TsaB
MILAIDTATALSGLALWNDGQVLVEETWRSQMTHSVELMPRIRRALTTCQLTVEQLTGLAVSLGPGSFTGLRTGLAAAKGMALPYRLPLVGIATLDSVAYPFQHSGEPVWAVIQAGRGRIGTACYAHVEEVWTQVVPPTLTTVEGLCRLVAPPAVLVGEISESDAELLRVALGSDACIPSPALRLRRAGCLAELAAARLDRHDVDDPDALAPIYLRTPEGHAVTVGDSNMSR